MTHPTLDLLSARQLHHLRKRGLVALTLLAALSSCSDEPVGPVIESHVIAFDFPERFAQPKVDVLLVVDSSPAMATHRDRLAGSYRRFADALTIGRGLADLHLGVVSADLGGPGCGPGDGGVFRHAGIVNGDFIVDLLTSSSGARERNYTGDLATAIATLADVGTTGCATAQPLAAMEQALTLSSGFRRADAALAVVFVSASDDASARSLDDTVEFLATVAPSDRVLVSVIGGPAGSSCATPATRLGEFATRFPTQTFTSICAEDHVAALGLLQLLHRSTLALWCLNAPRADVDPSIPGIQHACNVSDVRKDAAGATVEEPLPECDAAATTRPCWQFAPDAECEGDVHMEVERVANAFPGTHIVGQCVRE